MPSRDVPLMTPATRTGASVVRGAGNSAYGHAFQPRLAAPHCGQPQTEKRERVWRPAAGVDACPTFAAHNNRRSARQAGQRDPLLAPQFVLQFGQQAQRFDGTQFVNIQMADALGDAVSKRLEQLNLDWLGWRRRK